VSGPTDRHTHRQTDMLIAILHISTGSEEKHLVGLDRYWCGLLADSHISVSISINRYSF